MPLIASAGRASVAILALSFAAACGDSTGVGNGDLPPLRHDPILFVHGLRGSASSFDVMRARFVADGWRDGVELFAYTYNTTVTNAAAAQDIRNQVNHILAITGATKVDIISHEVGSLSSRYYLRNFGGKQKVDAWVSLGGPNHGTTLYKQCSFMPCIEMSTDSQFMTALNAEVEAQPPVRYATWQSPCDELIMPRSSVAIWDAANYITACMPNADLITDAAIYDQVEAFVR